MSRFDRILPRVACPRNEFLGLRRIRIGHQGMIYVGLPYSCPELTDISELKGGSPYGAATIAGPDGSRMPSAKELSMARFQGKHVAGIAARLK